MKSLYRVIVCSQANAEKFVPGEGDWYCISITHPEQEPAKLSKNFKGVLRLEFDDWDPREKLFEKSEVSEDFIKEYSPIAMSTDQADQVVNSFYKVWDKWSDENWDTAAPKLFGFVVHCRAGISRSNAVGRWIAEILNTSPEFWNVHPSIHGNGHISRLLKNADEKFHNVPDERE